MYTFYAASEASGVGAPWAPVWVAATATGVVAVALQASRDAFAAGLSRRGLVADERSAGPAARAYVEAAAAAVTAMLSAEPADAPEPAELAEPHDRLEAPGLGSLAVDLGDRPAWDCLVLGAVRAIPRGEVASYGEIARRIGRPGAARAVGGAMGRNPVGLLVPCHRVIAADGTLGGYGVAAMGGREAALDLKRALLALEGVRVPG